MMLQMIMENYLNNKQVEKQFTDEIIPQGENPIKVKKSQWQTFERKMQRVYTFKRTRTQEDCLVKNIEVKVNKCY